METLIGQKSMIYVYRTQFELNLMYLVDDKENNFVFLPCRRIPTLFQYVTEWNRSLTIHLCNSNEIGSLSVFYLTILYSQIEKLVFAIRPWTNMSGFSFGLEAPRITETLASSRSNAQKFQSCLLRLTALHKYRIEWSLYICRLEPYMLSIVFRISCQTKLNIFHLYFWRL